MARPKKKIDAETVKQLAAINCSYEEMSHILGVEESTLTRRFAQVIKEGRANGKMSLKRKQFQVAMTGNPQMLIWCGKVFCGQRETVEHINEVTINPKTLDEMNKLSESELSDLYKKKIG